VEDKGSLVSDRSEYQVYGLLGTNTMYFDRYVPSLLFRPLHFLQNRRKKHVESCSVY